MIENLLHRISQLQIREQDKNGYVKGLFPTQRVQPYFKYKREDNNIFFTSSTLFVLNKLVYFFSENEKQLLTQITENATLHYHLYQHKKGVKIYNFWQTGSDSAHFPNSNFLHKFTFFKLPDDIDTTALVYLTKPHAEEDILWLKNKAAQHANITKLQVQNTLPAFRDLHAYSSWFGEKMPIEFDVCVLCNFLYFVFENKLELNKNDLDTLKLLRAVILNSEYFKNPFRISPNYPETALILYHLARLMGNFSIPELDDLKGKLVEDIVLQLQNLHNSFMQKIILNSSLMKLGKTLFLPEIDEKIIAANRQNIEKFEWFTAGFLTVFSNSFIKRLAEEKLFHMKFSCEAFNIALIVEHEILKRKVNS